MASKVYGAFMNQNSPLKFTALLSVLMALGLALPKAYAGEDVPPPTTADVTNAIKQLRSETWGEREAAMDALRKMGPAALPALEELQKEKELDPELAWRVRTLVASIGLTSRATMQFSLDDLLKNFSEQSAPEKIQTLSTMAQRVGSACVPILAELLEKADEPAEVRAAAIRQLAWLEVDPKFLPVLVKYYKGASDEEKPEVLWTISGLRTPEAVKLALDALAAPDAGLKKMAVQALVRLGAKSDSAALRPLAKDAPDPELQIEALRALVSLSDAEAWPIQRSVLEKTESPQVAVEAIHSLAALREKRAAPLLTALLDDQRFRDAVDVKEAVLLAMGTVADASFIPVLKKYLNAPNGILQMSALVALGDMRAAEAKDEILALVSSGDEELRWRAVETISRMGHKPAIEKIKALLHEEERRDRPFALHILIAARALANLGDSSGVDKIVEIAGNGAERANDQAVAVITSVKLDEGIPRLRELSAAGNESATWGLVGMTDDPEPFEQLAKRYLVELRRSPLNAGAQASLARLFQQRGLSYRAATLYEELEKRFPGQYLSTLADLYHDTGRYAECDAAYARLSEKEEGENPTLLNNRSWFFCTAFKKEFLHAERALDLALRAVALEPQANYIVDTLGWAYFVNGKYEEAARELGRALDMIEPLNKAERAWERTRLARALWALGKKDEALKEVEHAVAERPSDPRVWLEAAGFYGFAGKRDDAVNAVHQAVNSGAVSIPTLELDPEFDSLRKDPGFTSALKNALRNRDELEHRVKELEAEIAKQPLNTLPEPAPEEGGGGEMMVPEE